jgi:hypothetical protein
VFQNSLSSRLQEIKSSRCLCSTHAHTQKCNAPNVFVKCYFSVAIPVLPQAVTQFEELVGMAETLLKSGGAVSTPASTLWRATNNSSPDSFASLCSNSNSTSSSPSSVKAEEEQHPGEKQVGWNIFPLVLWRPLSIKTKGRGEAMGCHHQTKSRQTRSLPLESYHTESSYLKDES